MRSAAMSAVWLAVAGAGALVTVSFWSTLPVWARVLLVVATAASFIMGAIAARRSRSRDSTPDAFIVGDTSKSRFVDNETSARTFQRGNSTETTYLRNVTGKRQPKEPSPQKPTNSSPPGSPPGTV